MTEQNPPTDPPVDEPVAAVEVADEPTRFAVYDVAETRFVTEPGDKSTAQADLKRLNAERKGSGKFADRDLRATRYKVEGV